MIRAGKLCRNCTDTKCHDLPEQHDDIQIECPTCGGHGCDSCDNGHFCLDRCPQEYFREVASAVHLIDLFHDGLPPVAGGALDQSAWFLHAARFLKNDEARIASDG